MDWSNLLHTGHQSLAASCLIFSSLARLSFHLFTYLRIHPMMDEDATAIAEWKEFLQSDRDDVRRAAMKAITEVAEVDSYLIDFVPILCRKSLHEIEGLQALLRLVTHGSTANACLYELKNNSGIPRLLEVALLGNGDNIMLNCAMSLLANLTRTEEGAVELVGKTLPDEAVVKEEMTVPKVRPTMDLLLHRFLTLPAKSIDYTNLSTEKLDSNSADPYQHFAAILMNSTQTNAGRRFIFQLHETQSTVLERLLPQLRSPNPIRRRGIAGVVRNACLERDSAWWLLNTVNITKHLLYPLAGPEALDMDEKQGLDPDIWLEGPDKVREPDHLTRLWLVEAILLLCMTGRKSRDTLRLARVYVILKLADMVEEQEDISERIYEIVNYLRRDEEGTPEGSSDQLVEQAYSKPAVSYRSENYEELD